MTGALAKRLIAAGAVCGSLVTGCATGGSDAGLVNGASTSSVAGSTTGGVSSSSSSGGGSSGGGSVGGGTTSGISTAGAFTPNTQISTAITVFEGYPRSGLGIVLGDFSPGPLTCADVYDGGPLSGTEVLVALYQFNPPYAVDVGTFTVIPPSSLSPLADYDAGVAVVFLAQFDGGLTFVATSNTGEVELTDLDAGTVVIGSFTAEMVDGFDGGNFGTLSGSFDAPWCWPPN